LALKLLLTKKSIIGKTYPSGNLPYPLSFDKLRMVSLVEPFFKGRVGEI
jgi:hypothetical protein